MKCTDIIVENEQDGTVTIDGAITIDGLVMDIKDAQCDKCQSEVIYYDDYDAYFCAYCNVWLEDRCGEPGCGYCANRPEKPLPNENERCRARNT